jgi:hypothetical protein
MNVPDEIKSAINLANDSFKAGHDAGYRLGYMEGVAAAKKMVEEILGTKPATPPAPVSLSETDIAIAQTAATSRAVRKS